MIAEFVGKAVAAIREEWGDALKNFGDKLAEAVKRTGSPITVGLDPRWEQLPAALRGEAEEDFATRASAYERFCYGIVDVVANLVPAVKPQAAFFEQCGPAGMAALSNVITYAQRAGLLVVLDGKRNDIGSTAEAYAQGYLGRVPQSAWQADALTISPYLGADSLEPFLRIAVERAAGLFILVKTSNPGSHMLQDQRVGEQSIYRHVAEYVESQSRDTQGEHGYGVVGAVVGATYPEQLTELREAMPHTWFLVPGYGSQGGTAADVAPAFDSRGLGALVNNSRGIIFAHARPEYQQIGEAHWQRAVEAATRDMIDQLRSDTPAGKLVS